MICSPTPSSYGAGAVHVCRPARPACALIVQLRMLQQAPRMRTLTHDHDQNQSIETTKQKTDPTAIVRLCDEQAKDEQTRARVSSSIAIPTAVASITRSMPLSAATPRSRLFAASIVVSWRSI